ncbi:MAG: hypothetical protein WCG12_06775 [Alcaligenaceae bacterium]
MTQPFRGIASTRSKSLGLPSLPILLIDHPLANRSIDEIESIAAQRLADVIKLLTDMPTQ